MSGEHFVQFQEMATELVRALQVPDDELRGDPKAFAASFEETVSSVVGRLVTGMIGDAPLWRAEMRIDATGLAVLLAHFTMKVRELSIDLGALRGIHDPVAAIHAVLVDWQTRTYPPLRIVEVEIP